MHRIVIFVFFLSNFYPVELSSKLSKTMNNLKASKVERKSVSSETKKDIKTVPYTELKQILQSKFNMNSDNAKKDHNCIDDDNNIFKSELTMASSNLKFWVHFLNICLFMYSFTVRTY